LVEGVKKAMQNANCKFQNFAIRDFAFFILPFAL
jgi:hypothetical protein